MEEFRKEVNDVASWFDEEPAETIMEVFAEMAENKEEVTRLIQGFTYALSKVKRKRTQT